MLLLSPSPQRNSNKIIAEANKKHSLPLGFNFLSGRFLRRWSFWPRKITTFCVRAARISIDEESFFSVFPTILWLECVVEMTMDINYNSTSGEAEICAQVDELS